MEGGGTKPQCRYLAEYFAFLHEFAKMGEEECAFLLHTGAISTIVNFYMGHKTQETYVSAIAPCTLAYMLVTRHAIFLPLGGILMIAP